MTIPKAIIVDLDGTLCDHSHRLHYIGKSTYHRYNGKLIEWIGEYSGQKPDYESFYAAMSEDGVNEWCSEIIQSMRFRFGEKNKEVDVIFVTERPEKYRNLTIKWFVNKFQALSQFTGLFMRPDLLPDPRKLPGNENYGGCFSIYPDHRPAHEVKREIYESEIKGKYEVIFAVEDDPDCVEMYRSLGLTCLDVGRK